MAVALRINDSSYVLLTQTTVKYICRYFSVHNQSVVDHIAESWQFLQEAVVAIQESRKLRDNLTQEDLYRYVDNLITQQDPSRLYYDLRGIL